MNEKLIVLTENQRDLIRKGDIRDFVKDIIMISHKIIQNGKDLESIQGPFHNTQTNEVLIILRLKDIK